MRFITEYNDFLDFDNFDNFEIEEYDGKYANEFIGFNRFYNFLKSQNILDEYVKKFHEYGVNFNNKDTIIKFLSDSNVNNYITNAFPSNPYNVKDNSRNNKWSNISKIWINQSK